MANNRPFTTIKRGRDFTFLKERGLRVRPSSWMVLSFVPNELVSLRCGWTISKKVGNAVLRNRFKRWCRHFFRTVQAPLPMGLDINVILLQQPTNFYKDLKQVEFDHCLRRGWQGVHKRLAMVTPIIRGTLP